MLVSLMLSRKTRNRISSVPSISNVFTDHYQVRLQLYHYVVTVCGYLTSVLAYSTVSYTLLVDAILSYTVTHKLVDENFPSLYYSLQAGSLINILLPRGMTIIVTR